MFSTTLNYFTFTKKMNQQFYLDVFKVVCYRCVVIGKELTRVLLEQAPNEGVQIQYIISTEKFEEMRICEKMNKHLCHGEGRLNILFKGDNSCVI